MPGNDHRVPGEESERQTGESNGGKRRPTGSERIARAREALVKWSREIGTGGHADESLTGKEPLPL
jgi:hypothetical protein